MVVLPVLFALATLSSAPPLAAQGRTAGGHPLDVTGLEVAEFEDYRTPAGRMLDGVWTVDLEARAAAWYPWGRGSRGLRAHVLSEAGEPPRVPGPMIRVTAGTPVRVTLRNAFPDTLVVRGLWDRSGEVGAGPGGGARGSADGGGAGIHDGGPLHAHRAGNVRLDGTCA